jgi:hypothetical protein
MGWAPLMGQALAETSDRSIEDPVVINQILGHLREKAETTTHTLLPESRAPPAGLFG